MPMQATEVLLSQGSKHSYLTARTGILLALLWPILSIANSNVLVYTLTEQDGLTDNTINCFYKDSKGLMWMGTSYGLNSYDGSVIRRYTAGRANALPDNVIN